LRKGLIRHSLNCEALNLEVSAHARRQFERQRVMLLRAQSGLDRELGWAFVVPRIVAGQPLQDEQHRRLRNFLMREMPYMTKWTPGVRSLHKSARALR
jgi:hypothetical protein